MKINIRATGTELTPAISSYVEKKVLSIEKYLDKSSALGAVAQVEVGKVSHHHKSGNVFRAEVHITGGGLDLYAVSEMFDLYAAIDTVRDEMVHNMLQLKGKRETIARRGAEMMKNAMKGLLNFKNFKKRQ